MASHLNARQIAFIKLAKLFTELSRVMPGDRDITQSEQSATVALLKSNFTAIMDEYDINRKNNDNKRNS